MGNPEIYAHYSFCVLQALNKASKRQLGTGPIYLNDDIIFPDLLDNGYIKKNKLNRIELTAKGKRFHDSLLELVTEEFKFLYDKS